MTMPQQPTSTLRYVQGVSGSRYPVQTDEELSWWERSRDAYMEQAKFTQNTDLQDMDKLLALELVVFRTSQHLNAGEDYNGDPVKDPQSLAKTVRELSAQIISLKKSMGLSKEARDAEANAGEFAPWFKEMRRRAQAWNLKRCKELDRALTLSQQVIAIVERFDRSNEAERLKAGFANEKAIVEWLRTVYIPEFREIDAHFIEHEQQSWDES